MAYIPASSPDRHSRLASQTFACPCGWQGKGKDAVIEPNSVVACPKCGKPVYKDGMVRPGDCVTK